MSEEKRLKVINSAWPVFLKYGYTRVTMDDLAKAAGISRPALYLIFDKKEKIFNAVVQNFGRQRLAEIKSGIASIKSSRKKLDYAFEVWCVKNFDSINSSKETKELLESTFDFAKGSLEENYGLLESILTDIIQDYPKSARPKEIAPKPLAHLLVGSVRGLKQICKNSRELSLLIGTLLDAVFRQ